MVSAAEQSKKEKGFSLAVAFVKSVLTLHSLTQGMKRIILLLAAILVYLWIIGLPQPIQRWILDQLCGPDHGISTRSVRVDPLHGLIIDGLSVRPQEQNPRLVASADRVTCGFSLPRSFDERPKLTSLGISNACWHVYPETAPDVSVALSNLMLQAQIRSRHDGHLKASASVKLCSISATGSWHTVDHGGGGGPPLRDHLRALISFSTNPPAPVQKVVQSDMLRANEPIEFSMAFCLDEENRARQTMELMGKAGRLNLFGMEFDEGGLQIQYTNEVWAVQQLTLKTGVRRSIFSGTFSTTNKAWEAHAYAELPLSYWLRVAPTNISSRFSNRPLSAGGVVCGEIWAGGDTNGPPRCWARMTADEAWLDKTPLQNLYFSYDSTHGNHGEISISGQAGDGPAAGPFDLSFHKSSTNQIVGAFMIRSDPHFVEPFLTSNQLRLIRRFVFESTPPEISGNFQGRLGESSALVITGQVRSTMMKYQQVHIDRARCDVNYHNETVHLENILIQRSEGEISGRVAVHVKNPVREFDLKGFIPPEIVVPMVGDNLAGIFTNFTFNGPVDWSARGTINAEQHALNQIEAHAQATDLFANKIHADYLDMNLQLAGGHYSSTNVLLLISGGKIEATFDVTEKGMEDVSRIECKVDNVGLTEIIRAFKPVEEDNQFGRLRGSFAMQFHRNDTMLAAATGSGSVAIRGDRLFRIPLLGGLSKLMGKIYPDLGYTAQTEFTADLRLADNKLMTDNAQLAGRVLTVRAKGHYNFEDRLNFTVEVKPMREGIVATAVQTITLPVTKLLEFNLRGPLADPQWRPANLPKELFLIFD